MSQLSIMPSVRKLPFSFMIALVLQNSFIFCREIENDVTKGKLFLGSFNHTTHLVQGDVYLNEDQKSLFVHRFYYDGKGPDFIQFVFVPKDADQWKDDGENGKVLQIEERQLNTKIEGEVLNKNLNLLLPPGFDVSNLYRLSFWCQKYGVSFGRMYPSESKRRPRQLLLEIGPFVDAEHAVSGNVFIKDNETLIIRDFSYDGTVRISSMFIFLLCENNLQVSEFSYKLQKTIQFSYFRALRHFSLVEMIEI